MTPEGKPSVNYYSTASNKNVSSLLNLNNVLQFHLGEVEQVEEIREGLIHHVFKVVGKERTGYLKIRDDHYATLPEIPSEPFHIRYEYKAMSLLSALEPEVFPHVLAYDAEKATLLMTDIMPNGRNLRTLLDSSEATDDHMSFLGRTIGRIHRRLEDVSITIREDEDKECYRKNLYYRLGYHNHPVLNALIGELSRQQRQLIIGDLSPKNIGVGENSRITICDLELVHSGNPEFDIGFLVGHVLLHNLDQPERSIRFILAALTGYILEQERFDLNSLSVRLISLGTILFRLKNPIIPYPLAITDETRKWKVLTALNLLDQPNISWERIVYEFSNA